MGVPYLFYRNASLFPTVVSLDKDTQDWTTPNVLETAEANDLSIDFGPDGKGISFILRVGISLHINMMLRAIKRFGDIMHFKCLIRQ